MEGKSQTKPFSLRTAFLTAAFLGKAVKATQKAYLTNLADIVRNNTTSSLRCFARNNIMHLLIQAMNNNYTAF